MCWCVEIQQQQKMCFCAQCSIGEIECMTISNTIRFFFWDSIEGCTIMTKTEENRILYSLSTNCDP